MVIDIWLCTKRVSDNKQTSNRLFKFCGERQVTLQYSGPIRQTLQYYFGV